MKLIGSVRSGVAALVFVGSAGLAVCGDPAEPQVPATFEKTGGNNQSSGVGAAVAIAPSVTIKTASGKGIAGIAVTFAVAGGGGSITGGVTTTDASGIATVGGWVLGTLAGANTLTAAAVAVPGSPVTFTATAVAGAATTIAKISTDPVSPQAGSNIDSITVKVADKFGNGVAGELVTFAVVTGAGTVSPASAITNANGLALARWTVGIVATTANSATATRAGLAVPTVTFSTTTGTAVTKVVFSTKTVVVDSLAVITPAVSAIDPVGNAIANAAISLVTRAPSTAAASGATVTGARTGQTFLVATSTDNPNAKDSAVVVVANVASPVVIATVPRFDLKTDTTFTIPLIIDMRSSGEKLGAATLQITWDPNVLTFVSEAEGTSAVGATINTTAAGTGSVTLAMASAAGFAGAVEIRKLTFKASLVASRTGALVLITNDLSGAVTLANLLPKTVSAFYLFRTR